MALWISWVSVTFSHYSEQFLPCICCVMEAFCSPSRTESGETMKAAGLKPIDTVVESSSILIKSKAPSNPELVELIASRIRGVITAQKYVLCQYNIPRNQLRQATSVTPGKRAPTITQLEEEGWVAVSAMVEKKKIAPTMDELAKVGATDILVLDIHNSRSD
jgi:ATP phosphoribosyltransferase